MVACLAYILGYPPRIWYRKPLRKFPSIVSACVDYFGTVFWNRPRPLPRHCRFIILSTLNNICADSEQRCRDPAWTVACWVSLVAEGMTVICVRLNVRVTQCLDVGFSSCLRHGRPFHSHTKGPHRSEQCVSSVQHSTAIWTSFRQHEYQHSLLYTVYCKINFSWTLHGLPEPPPQIVPVATASWLPGRHSAANHFSVVLRSVKNY